MKQFIITLSAVLALFGAGATVTAPKAEAAAAWPTTKNVLVVHEHTDWLGERYYQSVNWVGACDSKGYWKEIREQSRASSFSAPVGALNCTHVRIYARTITHQRGQLCYAGKLPIRGPLWCNDQVWGFNIYKGGV